MTILTYMKLLMICQLVVKFIKMSQTVCSRVPLLKTQNEVMTLLFHLVDQLK